MSPSGNPRKSTKCTNRSQAEKAAAAMTAAFRRRKVSAHVREVCLNFHREATGEEMPETSLRAYAETWLATKKNEVSTETKKADTARRTRRPFMVEEIHQILSACDDEWRGLVIFALHTGQRLGDLARLTRANVDETHGTLNLTTRKTRARIAIPLSADLRAVLKANPAAKGARPEAVPLFPKAWRIVKESGKVSTLSLQFTNILAAVNLREAVTHTSAKKGRDTAREVATVSFHSLRHSAVSLLKAAGVPDATVMALVGHETLAMSSHYTHVGKESLESAVASLPSFVPAPLSEQ